MESKKINQLATELTPDLSDLTIIGDPTTGVSKKITLSQMASLFTGTVEEYANLAAFPLVGTADTIYIALDTNVIYRWNTSTSAYVVLSPNIIASLVFNDANGFDGTISLVGSTATLTITTALTQGSVPFIGTSGALLQDNANFFWDDTNNRLGLATNAPTTTLDVFGSGIIGRINGTSTNNAFLGFASAGTNKWSIGNVQSDHRFRIFSEANSAELISILQTGEFGIGIANPTTKFHIDGGATALIANLDANVSIAKSVSFRSDNSNRFNIEVSGTESGSNAGADFFIRRYSDAGALIDTPLTITRSTGNATFSGILTTPQVKAATSAGLSINANSGTQVADFGAGGSANITFFGGLSGTSATFSSSVVFSSTTSHTGTAGFGIGSPTAIDGSDGRIITNKFRLYSTTPATIYHDFVTAATTNKSITIPDISGTLALLEGTQTFSGAKTFSSSVTGTSFIPTGGTAPTNGMYLISTNTLGFSTNTTERLRITSDGTLVNASGIYDTGASSLWYARQGGNDRIIADGNGYVYMPFLTTGSGIDDLGWWSGSGGSYISGGMLMRISSSQRYKKNIRDLELDTTKVFDLRTISYENNELTATDGLTSFGLLAEDVAEKIPMLATYNEEGKPEGVQYKMLSVLLLEEMKKLKAEIEILKSK